MTLPPPAQGTGMSLSVHLWPKTFRIRRPDPSRLPLPSLCGLCGKASVTFLLFAVVTFFPPLPTCTANAMSRSIGITSALKSCSVPTTRRNLRYALQKWLTIRRT